MFDDFRVDIDPAITGAGKTVMAAAVFEALFHGNDDYDFQPDPGAVVSWFSDDQSLAQGRARPPASTEQPLIIYMSIVIYRIG